MIALLTPFFARIVGARFAKAASWVVVALAALAALYGAYSAVHHAGVMAERHRWETKIAKANAKAKAIDDKAKETAATERVADAIKNTEQQKDYHDAIDKSQAGAPSDASVALACERLRRAGRDTAAISACRGR